MRQPNFTREQFRRGNASLTLIVAQHGPDRVGVVTFVGKQGVRLAFGQPDQGIIRLAICRLTNRQVEGEWSSEGISQAVKFTGLTTRKCVLRTLRGN